MKTTRYSAIAKRSRIISLTISMLTILFLTYSCSYYQVFSSNFKGLNFTFEYPRWDTQSYDYGVEIYGPDVASENESILQFWISVTPIDLYTTKQDSKQNVKDFITRRNIEPNFKIIKQDTVTLGGTACDSVDMVYDFPVLDNPDFVFRSNDEQRYITTRDYYICAIRGRNAYEIEFTASQDEFISHEEDIQHILGTFRWK